MRSWMARTLASFKPPVASLRKRTIKEAAAPASKSARAAATELSGKVSSCTIRLMIAGSMGVILTEPWRRIKVLSTDPPLNAGPATVRIAPPRCCSCLPGPQRALAGLRCPARWFRSRNSVAACAGLAPEGHKDNSRGRKPPDRTWHQMSPGRGGTSCDWHGQEIGGERREAQVLTRSPDEGNPKPMWQEHRPGAPGGIGT